ncbi:MAG: lysoplasmalogenase [Spirochaetales bacterium]|nr:lysoplasmalogenase [Spirochaetales bacterium]
MTVFFLVLLAAVTIGHIIAVTREHRIRYFLKPLIVPSVIAIYLLQAQSLDVYLLLGLICGFFGDFLLMWKMRVPVLLAGMIFFLAGHVFYIAAFLSAPALSAAVPFWVYTILPVYAAFGIIYFLKVIRHIKASALKIPVIVYLVIILAMGFSGFLRFWTAGVCAAAFTFTGSILFILSDSIFAYHNFARKLKQGLAWVMATYVAAQLCIMAGFLPLFE